MRTIEENAPCYPTLTHHQVESRLGEIPIRVAEWLKDRRAPGNDGFTLCASGQESPELNATTGGIELWTLLDLPLSDRERTGWVERLRRYQNPQTGLVIDPTWVGRQQRENPAQVTIGDSFFTMTACAALEALGSRFLHPVAYLAKLSAVELSARTQIAIGACDPYSIGDYGRLVRMNATLGVPNADEQWERINADLLSSQDPETGLWTVDPDRPLTPAINLGFHLVRSSWNLDNRPCERPEAIIDSCLTACRDERYYGWTTGFACNDLDLALMFHTASTWTNHRSNEVQQWGRERLPMLLAVQKPDGGFSFHHSRAMQSHGGIYMSGGGEISDMWGTLMYLGAIKMTAELAYPGLQAPWKFSRVHAVPEGREK